MTPKNRHNKSNIKTFEKIKTPGMHFFNDAPNFALRVTNNFKKSYYASYGVVVGVKPDGTLKRQGKYKFLSRMGAKPLEEVKREIAANIEHWKKSPDSGVNKAPTVGTLVEQFMRPGAAVYRIKKKGGKIKYKENTLDGYRRVLEPYILEKTADAKITDRLTSKVKINGQYNADRLKDIKLSKLTKDHIKNHHERLAETPRAANLMLAALSVVFSWDMNRGGSKLWQGDHNPCFSIEKFPEKKDKKFLGISKVLEIINYIKNNLWRDPHFLACYMLLLDIGERELDVFGLAWREPASEAAKLKCSGWLINNNTQIFLRDPKDRQEAIVDLTPPAIEVINKLMDLKSNNDSFAAGSMFVFPRSSDPTQHINYSSYRKKLEKFNYKFGLAKRELVSSYGTRKRYKYLKLYSFKHLRKTFGTHYGRRYGLQEQSERMRHSSTKVTSDHYYNAETEKFKGRSAYDVGSNVVQLKEGTNND